VAEIHRTTMAPGKLELLSRWMAEQPWYLGKNGPPTLTKAGGFRFDDPMGEVGIEFMFVTDAAEEETNIYHVPLSYRGAPLIGAGVGLLGTAEHGVLGRRWIYDGAHDPVVVAGLLALAQGAAEPQHQNLSDTPDPSVAGRSSGAVRLTASSSPSAPPRSDGSRTSIDLVAVDQSGSAAGRVAVEIMRILRAGASTFLTDGSTAILGHVEAEWGGPAGSTTRGCIALVR
jgi:hypothetical protein